MTNGLRRAGTCPPVRESLDGASAKFKPWTLHDLRRGVATGMAEQLGVAPHVVEAVLNHASGHKAGVARTWSALPAGFALAGLAVNG